MPEGGARGRRPVLDWKDEKAVLDWSGRMRAALEDGNDVVEDMLLPLRQRDYGPAMHAERYREAWKQVLQLLAYATPSGPEGVAPDLSG